MSSKKRPTGAEPIPEPGLNVDDVLQAALGDARPYYYGAALRTLATWGPGQGVAKLDHTMQFLQVLRGLELKNTGPNAGGK